MTLQTNEVVYTADLMNIAPANDAQIYGMSGDWILNGLNVVQSSASSITLSSGRAIIQGRLFELKANTSYSLNSRAGFIGLQMDLTESNSEDEEEVTNNQFTFGFGSREFGDTLQGDVNAFRGLYKLDGKGGYEQNVFNYYRRQASFSDWGNGYFENYRNQEPIAVREGRTVSITGALRNKYTFRYGEVGIVRVLPKDMRPAREVITLEQGSNNTIFMLGIRPNGEMYIKRGRHGSNNYNYPAGSWFNLHTTYNIEY